MKSKNIIKLISLLSIGVFAVSNFAFSYAFKMRFTNNTDYYIFIEKVGLTNYEFPAEKSEQPMTDSELQPLAPKESYLYDGWDWDLPTDYITFKISKTNNKPTGDDIKIDTGIYYRTIESKTQPFGFGKPPMKIENFPITVTSKVSNVQKSGGSSEPGSTIKAYWTYDVDIIFNPAE